LLKNLFSLLKNYVTLDGMNETKFGIVITTYQRPDGKTPFYLKRAIDSVLLQKHTNWKLYLIGDKYNDNDEFIKFVSWVPSDKIIAINLPVAIERQRYPNGGEDLWHSAGATASNLGIELSVGEGYNYVCKLDHDDTWSPDHLMELNGGILETGADLLYTKSTYRGGYLPMLEVVEKYTEHLPQPQRTINSSICVNYKKILLRRRDPMYFFNERFPGDAYFYKRLKPLNIKSIYINKLTCFHDEEGYARTLTPEQIQR